MRHPNFARLRPAGCCLLGMLMLVLPANAQQTTERFIPIGQSPGISGLLSTIGTIGNFDATAGTLEIEATDGRKSFRVTAQTRIWIDRSAARQASLVGDRDDLAAGSRVEVMHRRDDPQAADWIKIAAN